MRSTKSKVVEKDGKIVSAGKAFTKESIKSYRNYQKAFMKQQYRTFIFRLKRKDDEEIITYLESKDNLSKYLRDLIDNDMKQSSNNLYPNKDQREEV